MSSKRSSKNTKKKDEFKCIYCLKKIIGEIGEEPELPQLTLSSNKDESGEEEPRALQTQSNKPEEEKEGTMLTNIPESKYNEILKKRAPQSKAPSSCCSAYRFKDCYHIICIKCIARILFSTTLNTLPSSNSFSFTCTCNQGLLTLPIDTIAEISFKINEPDKEKICPKHSLVYYRYCLDCKIYLCKKCDESHSDLFTNHNIVKNEPPNSSTCKYHPNCFLDMLCKDCHCTVCHLCIVEGNQHFCHNTISFDSLRERIITNVHNMKFDNFIDFEKYINKCDSNYNKTFEADVNNINKIIDDIMSKILTYKKEFNENMERKKTDKDIVVTIMKNIYNFFYKEYSNVQQSVDYPVLCLYQVMNTELISFHLQTPDFGSTYLSKLESEVESVEVSSLFTTKYQFSLKNFEPKVQIAHHTKPITSLATLNDGRLVSASDDKTIAVWGKDLSKPLLVIKDNAAPVKVLKVLNDHRLIAGSFKEMRIYNVNSMKCENILKETSNQVVSITQLDDGRIISGSYREMRIFSMTWNNSYKDSRPVKDHTSWVKTLLNLKGRMFATGGDDAEIRIYDYNIKCIRIVKCENEINVMCPSASDDEDDINAFYFGDNYGRIYIYNFVNDKYEVVADVDQHHGAITDIINLYGGNYASCSSDGVLTIRDVKFNPIQYINKNDNKAINTLTQIGNGNICAGGDSMIISIYE